MLEGGRPGGSIGDGMCWQWQVGLLIRGYVSVGFSFNGLPRRGGMRRVRDGGDAMGQRARNHAFYPCACPRETPCCNTDQTGGESGTQEVKRELNSSEQKNSNSKRVSWIFDRFRLSLTSQLDLYIQPTCMWLHWAPEGQWLLPYWATERLPWDTPYSHSFSGCQGFALQYKVTMSAKVN